MIVLEWFHKVLKYIETDDLYKDMVCYHIGQLATLNVIFTEM